MDPTVSTPSGQQDLGNNLAPQYPPSPLSVNSQKRKQALYVLIGGVFIVFVTVILLFMLFRNEDKKSIVTENKPTTVPSVIQKTTEYDQLDIEVKKNESLTVEKLSASFLYEEQESIIPDCFDCMTSGKVTVTKGDKSEVGVFSCGGVAGVCDEEKTLLGLQVIVKKRNSEMISLTIKYPKE